MKVLITGGAGFVGSHLGDAFLARGDEVVALDLCGEAKIRHNLDNPRFTYVQDTILDSDVLETLIYQCDLVYHLAAVVGVEHYVSDPFKGLNVNVNGTQNVLKYATRYKKRLVFSSTSEIYGRNPKVPFAEDSDRVLGPTSIDRWAYSTSKAVGEHFCFAYRQMGLQPVIIRYFNVYGPRLDAVDKGRVITVFLGQLLRGKDITVVGNGQQTRCFTYIDDAVRATVNAGLKDEAVGGIFNIGTDRETTLLELAETMIRLFGGKSKIQFVPQEKMFGPNFEDVSRRVPDVTRMNRILGVKAGTSLEAGLRKTIDWFRAAPEGSGL
jgi:UDP-glucose 4-epimerase